MSGDSKNDVDVANEMMSAMLHTRINRDEERNDSTRIWFRSIEGQLNYGFTDEKKCLAEEGFDLKDRYYFSEERDSKLIGIKITSDYASKVNELYGRCKARVEPLVASLEPDKDAMKKKLEQTIVKIIKFKDACANCETAIEGSDEHGNAILPSIWEKRKSLSDKISTFTFNNDYHIRKESALESLRDQLHIFAAGSYLKLSKHQNCPETNKTSEELLEDVTTSYESVIASLEKTENELKKYHQKANKLQPEDFNALEKGLFSSMKSNLDYDVFDIDLSMIKVYDDPAKKNLTVSGGTKKLEEKKKTRQQN